MALGHQVDILGSNPDAIVLNEVYNCKRSLLSSAGGTLHATRWVEWAFFSHLLCPSKVDIAMETGPYLYWLILASFLDSSFVLPKIILQDAKRLLKATSNSLQIRFQELIRFKSRLLDAKGCSQPFSWAREYLLQARSARLDKPAEKPVVPVAVTFVMDATGEIRRIWTRLLVNLRL